MARAIPAAISDALASNIRNPTLSAQLFDDFDRPYDSITNSHAGRSAIAQLPNGSYVRAYVDSPGLGLGADLYTQVISDLTNPTQLNAYGLLNSGAEQQAGVALALFASTIYLFFQRQSDHAICFCNSSDGSTWSAQSVLYSPGTRAWALASSGNNELFAAIDHTAGNDSTQDILYFSWNGTTWSAGATWSNPPTQVTGLAAAYQAGIYRLAAGALTRGSSCFCTMTYDGATSWSALTAIHPIDDAGTGLSAPYPGLAFLGGIYRAVSTVYDSGLASPSAGQKTEMWTSPDFVHWYLEQLLNQPFTNGSEIITGPTNGWVVADAGISVRSTAAANATNPPIDVADDLLNMQISEPKNQPATATITLDNSQGTYIPSTSPTTALRIGARLDISLGYTNTVVKTHSLYVDSMAHANAGIPEAQADFDSGPERVNPFENETGTVIVDQAVITIKASNRKRLHDRTIVTDRVHTGATVAFLAAEAAVNGGIPATPTTPATTQFTQPVDTFAFHAGQTWHDALARIASIYGFDHFADENDQLQIREPLSGDSSSFAYQIAGTPPEGHSLTPQLRANYVRVVGRTAAGSHPAFAEAIDYTDLQDQGATRHVRVTDRTLTSAAACAIRAGLELRKQQRQSLTGWAQLPLNPAHQVLDVITLSSDVLSPTNVRIAQLDWIVDYQTGDFYQVAHVEAP